ncbi:MAG: nitroreductase family protein [Actinobacteria bacterium]|nr:nitroreductase family protein [Actinomycetota bacterium]
MGRPPGMKVGALEYHRLTVHVPGRLGRRDDPRTVQGFRPMEPNRKPPPFKTYPGLAAEPVPPALDDLLFLSAGVVRVKDHPGFGRLYFRAAGSAGNLSPVEVYVLHEGRVLHYEPVQHALSAVGRVGAGPTTVVLTGVPWRTGWKYAERGFRHLYWDAGTMLSHLLAAAAGDARLRLGFVDSEVAAVVGADGVNEFALAMVVLGEGDPPVSPLAGHPARRGFLAERPVEFPLITAAQRAGDLADQAAVEAWRAAAPQAPAPADVCFGQPLGEVVRRRGSSRDFDPAATVPTRVLTEVLAAAAAPLNADFTPPGASLVGHHLLVHAVDGFDPGSYHSPREGRIELVEARQDSRALGRFLTLDQDLGGAGAYTVFTGADLEAVTATLGDRGYRCAQLEAGVIEGRLHLGAYALGFGATGLTFFDEEVRRAFATSNWPMLATAVGQPTYRSKRGGDPGRPTVLSNFG